MAISKGPYEYLNRWIGLDADQRPNLKPGKTKAKKGDEYFKSDTGLWEKYDGKGNWKEKPPKHSTAVVSSIWDSANKGPDQVLSNSDLTVTGGVTSDYETVYTTAGKTTGSLYFEVDITQPSSSSYESVGVGPGTQSNEDSMGRDSTGGWCLFNYLGGNARHYYNNAYNSITNGGSGATAFTVMVAVDIDTGEIWFGHGGTWYGGTAPDPATGTEPAFTGLSGTLYIGGSTYLSSHTLTLVCASADQTYTAPSGFTAWDD